MTKDVEQKKRNCKKPVIIVALLCLVGLTAFAVFEKKQTTQMDYQPIVLSELLPEEVEFLEGMGGVDGNPLTFTLLAGNYEKGMDGFPQDQEKALEWYTKAAERNDELAQLILGLAYHDGSMGAAQNYEEAFKWLYKASENGYMPAQTSLGIMYLNGNGVHKNKDKALIWFKRAAEQGDEDARKMIRDFYE